MAEPQNAFQVAPNGGNTFSPEGTVRVMVWNVRNLTTDKGRWGISLGEHVDIAERAKAIAGVIKASGAHLSILLETGMDAETLMSEALRGVNGAYTVQSTPPTGGPAGGEERRHQRETYTLVTVVTSQDDLIGNSIAGAAIALVDNAVAPGAPGARSPAMLELKRDDHVVATIYAVHAPSPGRKSTVPYLEWAARLLEEHVGCNRILCGDFNVRPEVIQSRLLEYRPVFAGPKTTIAAGAKWRLLNEKFESQAYDQAWAMGNGPVSAVSRDEALGWVAQAAEGIIANPTKRIQSAIARLMSAAHRLFIAAGGEEDDWNELVGNGTGESVVHEEVDSSSEDDVDVCSEDLSSSYDSKEEDKLVSDPETLAKLSDPVRRARVEAANVVRSLMMLRARGAIEAAIPDGRLDDDAGGMGVHDDQSYRDQLRDECDRYSREVYPLLIRTALRTEHPSWVNAIYVSDHLPVVFDIGAQGAASSASEQRPRRDEEQGGRGRKRQRRK